MRGMFRCSSALAVAFLLIGIATSSARAQAATQFDLPAQSLADSLKAVANQTNTNVLFDSKLVEGMRAPALRAQLTPQAAVARLLAGTGFRHELVNEHTIVLTRAEPKEGAPKPIAAVQSDATLHLAQSEAPPAAESSAAQSAAREPEKVETEVLVTGTRRTGLQVSDSPAPVQILDANMLTRTGQPDLVQALAQNVPSFTAQSFAIDTGGLTQFTKLRGLSPNHALVLVNGKRRHTTANLNVRAGPYQGGASVDFNFIPVSAIERIEVLTDGAAAQYGTDAIAGVVNIILRDNSSGGSVSASGGGYMDGDGETFDVSANLGFTPGADGSYFNFTAEGRTHDYSNRTGIDPRVVDPATVAANPSMLMVGDYPYLNHAYGDPRYELYVASFNAGTNLGSSGTQFYSYGTYGRKHSESHQIYRVPSRLPAIYPFGFTPREELVETDISLTAGIKGSLLEAWRWDLGTTYGKDDEEINTLNSANISLYTDTGATPTDFHAGDFIATQWTTNLDFNRDIEVGLASPLNFAFGLEHRRETYQIKAGDPASRYKEGSQSFPGFALSDAGSHDRDNNAVYVDFALSPVKKLQLDVAGRYEDYSDFGNTTIGKLTGRYDFTDAFALRGTFSTGFRAPTMAEEYYSATNVKPDAAFVQLPPNAAAAKLLGIDGLKAEKSTNYSLGVVMHPTPRVTATLDAYQIDIKDRIAGSGTLFGMVDGVIVSSAVTAAIQANGNVLDPTVTNTGINIFANGLDTRTRGAELVLTHSDRYSFGRLDLTLSANYNETEVTKVAPTPAPLAPQSLFDVQAISTLETSSPKYRLIAGSLWTLGRFSVNLRETIYGKASQLETRTGSVYYRTVIGVTPITDLELAYQARTLKFTVGANNLFNRYPSSTNPALLADYRAANDITAIFTRPAFSPFGINGGYYYAKASFNF